MPQELQEQKEPQLPLHQEQQQSPILSSEQIQSFITDGVLVVDNVLSYDEIVTARTGLHDTLFNKYNVDTTNLYHTGHLLTRLSSTNGSGGVLDIYYEPWQIQLFATNSKLFHMTTELWKHMYLNDHDFNNKSNNEGFTSSCLDDIANDKKFMWHPCGSFDYRKGYMYLDRVGYRLPTQLAYDIAVEKQHQEQQEQSIDHSSGNNGTTPLASKKKKKKVFPIQRSLTPHFDCCPSTMYNKTGSSDDDDSTIIKWRPIQCFISLTDTLEPNHGGFEAVKGFHQEFHTWSQHQQSNAKSNVKETKSLPAAAPCIGEYTHLRPKEDHDIYQRIQHIPVSAGSAVFWDNRYVSTKIILGVTTDLVDVAFLVLVTSHIFSDV